MIATDDTRIRGYKTMIPPRQLKQELQTSQHVRDTVAEARRTIENIVHKQDKRLLVISGPCSIHDEEAALDYAERLKDLHDRFADTMYIVMRVYFEKPRTTGGWKGLINDPHLDGSCDMETGLHKARRLLLRINEMGIPVATEFLDPIITQYIADLVSWAAIGARTTESQTHRQMASGLSMPVGFKNNPDGNLSTAVNAMIAAKEPQSFLGIDQEGSICNVHTRGNSAGHVVLRGGHRPNYDPIHVEEARSSLEGKGLPQSIIVDCSHANSCKKHEAQATVLKHVLDQIYCGSGALIGIMLESNIREGKQKFSGDPSELEYGVSITDACIGWETTESLLQYTHQRLESLLAQPA